MLTLAQLRSRGWSTRLIEKFLGDPDQTRKNPKYPSKASMRLWKQGRVEVEEQNQEFIDYQAEREKRSARAKAAAQRKRQKLLDLVETIDIYVELRLLSDIYPRVSPKSKKRKAVKYIRHNLCSSNHALKISQRETRIDAAKALLDRKFYRAITRFGCAS